MSYEKNGKEAPMAKNRHWRFSQPLKNHAIQILENLRYFNNMKRN